MESRVMYLLSSEKRQRRKMRNVMAVCGVGVLVIGYLCSAGNAPAQVFALTTFRSVQLMLISQKTLLCFVCFENSCNIVNRLIYCRARSISGERWVMLLSFARSASWWWTISVRQVCIKSRLDAATGDYYSWHLSVPCANEVRRTISSLYAAISLLRQFISVPSILTKIRSGGTRYRIRTTRNAIIKVTNAYLKRRFSQHKCTVVISQISWFCRATTDVCHFSPLSDTIIALATRVALRTPNVAWFDPTVQVWRAADRECHFANFFGFEHFHSWHAYATVV